jgi:copper resistance protein B
MKTVLIALLAAAATPALAQHQGHDMPVGMKMDAPKAKPPARPKAVAKPAARRAPAARPKSAARRKAGKSGAAASHAVRRPQRPAAPQRGHDMHAMPMPADPHAGHAMPMPADPHAGHEMAAPADPHAGHDMPTPANPHAGHDMGAMQPGTARPGAHAGHDMSAMAEASAPPVAPPPPAALSGPAHAADTVYGAEAMARARAGMRAMHGDVRSWRVLVDQAEARIQDGRNGWYLNGEAWYGGDIDRVGLKVEGEGAFGRRAEQAEVQALWSHAVNPWFNLQAGLRYDLRPDPERGWVTAGVQGLAPYWIEVDAALFLSNRGELTARAEGEYDLRLTQKWILQPRVEVDLSAQDIPALHIGAGLSSAEAGLRLRYQVVPEFAPYLGLAYQRAFGDTAGFRRSAGERTRGWSLALGIRAWF